MSVSIKIKNIRNQLRMSQQEFADCIGFSQSVVAQWELGQKIPKHAAMLSIFNVAKSKRIKITMREFFEL